MPPLRSALRSTRWCVQDHKNEADEALVARAQKGDAAAAEELMDRYKNTVRRIARKFAFNMLAETDDLVQEGMIGLYLAIGRFSPAAGKSFKNFVYVCVVRKIYSYLRTVFRHKGEGERSEVDPESIPEGATPEELLISGESEAEFRLRLVKTLSDFEFRVVSMYLEGMSYAQISAATGKEIKSVDNALMRAKRKLSESLY